jgi:hypothetical protein
VSDLDAMMGAMTTPNTEVRPIAHSAEEALVLLARFAEERSPDEQGRALAVERLFADLLALNGRTRVTIRKDDLNGGVWISIQRRSVKVSTDGNGSVYVAVRDGAEFKEVSLAFNVLSGHLESPHEDTFRGREPGTASRRRSALAEVVEAALEVMKGQS